MLRCLPVLVLLQRDTFCYRYQISARSHVSLYRLLAPISCVHIERCLYRSLHPLQPCLAVASFAAMMSGVRLWSGLACLRKGCWMEKFENNNFKLYEYLFTSWIITVGNAMSRHRRDFFIRKWFTSKRIHWKLMITRNLKKIDGQ